MKISFTFIYRDYCAEDCERRLRETRECTREKCYGDQEKSRISETKCDCPIITKFEEVPPSTSKAICLAQIASTHAKIFHLENHHAIQKLHFKPISYEAEGQVSFVFRDRFCVSGTGFRSDEFWILIIDKVYRNHYKGVIPRVPSKAM